MLPSCTRVAASRAFCSALARSAAARDSSSGTVASACGDGAAVWAAGCSAVVPARGPAACWLPIIQPTIRPKNTPATPKRIDSLGTGLRSAYTGDTCYVLRATCPRAACHVRRATCHRQKTATPSPLASPSHPTPLHPISCSRFEGALTPQFPSNNLSGGLCQLWVLSQV